MIVRTQYRGGNRLDPKSKAYVHAAFRYNGKLKTLAIPWDTARPPGDNHTLAARVLLSANAIVGMFVGHFEDEKNAIFVHNGPGCMNFELTGK
jgi:hypothetical protein